MRSAAPENQGGAQAHQKRAGHCINQILLWGNPHDKQR
jgi:hypothetical protein